jgi:hypothetical protein
MQARKTTNLVENVKDINHRFHTLRCNILVLPERPDHTHCELINSNVSCNKKNGKKIE